jgi:hypothetical protein
MNKQIFDNFNINDPAPRLTEEQEKQSMKEFLEYEDKRFIKCFEEIPLENHESISGIF